MSIQKLRARLKAFKSGIPALEKQLNFKIPSAVPLRIEVDTKEVQQLIEKLRNLNISDKLLAKLEGVVDEALTEAINATQWKAYDGTTVDIVDTGALRASQKVQIQGNSLVITYDVPYANLVHFGGYVVPYGNSFADRVFIPARPWTSIITDGSLDLQGVMAEEIKKILRNLV